MASAKAQRLFDALTTQQLPLFVSRGQWDITVTAFSFTPDGNGITISGDVKKGGVSLPISWPIVIVNPPSLVPDPTGSVVKPILDHDGNVVGERRFRDDTLEALMQTFADVIQQAGG